MDIPDALKSIFWIGALFFGLYWLFRAVPAPSVERTERIERETIHHYYDAKSDKEKAEIGKVLISETELEQKAVEKEIKKLKEQKISPIPEENNVPQAQVSQEESFKRTQLDALKKEFYSVFNQMNSKVQEVEQKDRELLAIIDEKKKIEEEYNLSFNSALLGKIEKLQQDCENKQKEIAARTAEINDMRSKGEKIKKQYEDIKNSLTKRS